MNPNVKDKKAADCMNCGEVAGGVCMEATHESPEGISAKLRDGKRVFVPANFVAVMKRQARGR